MKKIIISLFAAVAAVSCVGSNEAKIELALDGGAGKNVIVSILNTDEIAVVDTLKLNDRGTATCKVAASKGNPQFYYLSYGRRLLSSLILEGGESVKVSADTLGRNLVVSGSEKTAALLEVNKLVDNSNQLLDSLATAYQNAEIAGDAEAAQSAKHSLGTAYRDYKLAAIKYIIEHPYEFANVNLLYQRITPLLALFADSKDVVYFQRVYDSLSVKYPSSRYVERIGRDMKMYGDALAMDGQIGSANEIAFPDIELPDVNGQKIKLSSLLGKPFILYFWTSTNAGHKMINHELKSVYEKYHSKGLEIYMVCVDVDKKSWATTVKAQELPWINVCDGLAEASPAVGLYNVTEIPSLFIFNSEGDIVGKNVLNTNSLCSILDKIVK